jgi:hypothetical protein
MSSHASRAPHATALLIVAIVGFIVPNAMVIAFLAEHGLAIGDYFSSWFDSLPAAQLTADLAICCAAFFVWAAFDGPRSGVPRWWLCVPATLLVGLCFGLPLYLYWREAARAA